MPQPETPQPGMPQYWYRRLILRLEHAAFVDGVCPAAWLEPRPDTALLLARHRIGVRRVAAGLALIVADGPARQPLFPLPPGTMLAFLVCADSPDFLLYTELPPAPASGAPWTARVSVNISGDCFTAAGAQTPSLVVHLDARALYWRYYCALPQGMDRTGLAINQDTTLPYPTRITFAVAQAPAPNDLVAHALAVRNPDRDIVVLTSNAPIPVWTGAAPRLTLNRDGEAIMDLRSPPLDSLLLPGLPTEGKPVAFRTVIVPSN